MGWHCERIDKEIAVMPFLSPLVAEFKVGEIGAVIHEPFGYQCNELDLEIWVDKGFDTDFGSVPSFLVDAIVPAIGQTPRAFVVHDWIYRQSGLIETMDQMGKRLKRKHADLIMKNIMIEEGLSPWRAYIAYAGVRVGGNKPWGKYLQANHGGEWL